MSPRFAAAAALLATAVSLSLLAHAVYAQQQQEARVRTDAAGNLHLSTAPGQKVFFNGVDVVAEMAALRAGFAALLPPSASTPQSTPQSTPTPPPQSTPAPTPPPTSQLTPAPTSQSTQQPTPAPTTRGSSATPGSTGIVNSSQTMLAPSSLAALDEFGTDCDISGDTIVVGARFHDAGGNQGGATYVYQWTGTAWAEQAKLLSPDIGSGHNFGRSVGIEGDTLVATSFGDDELGSAAGAAHVYVRQPGGTAWTHHQKLTASDGAAGDLFGTIVSMCGDTIALGTNRRLNSRGAVYVFVRAAGATTWTQQAIITAHDASPSDHFGRDLSLSGDTLAVGASGDDDGGVSGSGSIYVYTRTGTAWSLEQKLTPSGARPLDAASVTSLDGDTLAVGVFQRDTGASLSTGIVFVFRRTGGSWALQQKLMEANPVQFDLFGWSLAVNERNGTIIVGAPSRGAGGAAYVFKRDASGAAWAQQSLLTAFNGATGGHFGQQVAIQGDTVLVGAYDADGLGPGSRTGALYVF